MQKYSILNTFLRTRAYFILNYIITHKDGEQLCGQGHGRSSTQTGHSLLVFRNPCKS